MSRKRVIVTGGNGFIGANLVRRLEHDGHEIHLIVRPGYTPWRIESIRVDARLQEVDLRDWEGIKRAVNNIRADWIFHLGAYGAHAMQTDKRRMVETNIIGTMNLVEACLRTGCESFINTGSSSEYGFKDHAPSETEVLEPNSHYAVTKASATLFCRFTGKTQGVHLTTLRLYSVYGPYEEPTRLIPTLILRGLNGELPPLVSPETARDFIYVDDLIEAYLLAAERPDQEHGAVYNVGTGAQTSMREVVDVARRSLGISGEPRWGSMPSREWDTGVWVADNRKIKNDLAWQPRQSFEEGFQLTAEFYRSNPSLCDFHRARCRRIP